MRFEERKFKTIQYLVRFPDGYTEGKKCPVLFCIHGAGGRGGTYEQFKTHPEMSHSAKIEGFPFVTVAPICPKADGTWFDFFETLKELIRFVISECRPSGRRSCRHQPTG